MTTIVNRSNIDQAPYSSPFHASVDPNGLVNAEASDLNIDKIDRFCGFLLRHAKNSSAVDAARKFLNCRDISALNSVTTLDLTSSHLKKLPDDIELLPNLTVLNLANNQLTSLPASVSRLTKLDILNLDANQFDTVPVHVFGMQIKCLHIYNNPIQTVPLFFKDIIVAVPYMAKWE
ncbi:MAG: leucine-rich repeat domain-containing protein [Verrucomicrobia bacterium]|nr:leucine-rich repeat domain-containing protein [Verrucomicrobiota bacterium]